MNLQKEIGIQRLYNRASNEGNYLQQELIINNIHHDYKTSQRVTIRENRDFIINSNIIRIIKNNRRIPASIDVAKLFNSSTIKDTFYKLSNPSNANIEFDKKIRYKEFISFLITQNSTHIQLFTYNLCKTLSCSILDEETLALLTPLMDKVYDFMDNQTSKYKYTHEQFKDLFNITEFKYRSIIKQQQKIFKDFF